MPQIFRAGVHVDAHGLTRTITRADLEATISAYDPALHDAPAVIGHPEQTAPAYGWVRGLKMDGDVLSADFADVDPEFKEMVNKRRFPKVSASFYPPDDPRNPKPGVWYLRHVGFLGAAAPIVKGLAPANFSEDEAVVTFTADFAEDPAGDTNPSTDESDPKTDEQEAQVSKEELDAAKAEAEKEKARADAAEARIKEIEAAQAKAVVDADHQAHADFAEQLAKDGKLPPAHKALVTQVLDFISHPESITADFAEGDKSQPLSTALKGMLSALPAANFAEMATKDAVEQTAATIPAEFAEADPEAISLHQRATAIAASENISYESAVRRALTQ